MVEVDLLDVDLHTVGVGFSVSDYLIDSTVRLYRQRGFAEVLDPEHCHQCVPLVPPCREAVVTFRPSECIDVAEDLVNSRVRYTRTVITDVNRTNGVELVGSDPNTYFRALSGFESVVE